MTKKTEPKPTEICVNEGTIVVQAKEALELHARVAEMDTQLQTARKLISDEAQNVWGENADKGTYVGIVRVTGDDFPPIRIEFRQTNGALDITEEQRLNELFGAARSLLWDRGEVVKAVTDPQKAIDDLKAKGLNPFDYLKVDVKKNMDSQVIAATDAVTSAEGLLPQKAFLETLNSLAPTLSDEAKAYIREYLEKSLSTTVVLAAKSKGG